MCDPKWTSSPRNSPGIAVNRTFGCTKRVKSSAKFGNHAGRGDARVILLLGAPGSGKGTQSAMLGSSFGIQSISTGAILREFAKRNTPEGFRLRQTLAAGELVDKKTVCEAVAARLKAMQSASGQLSENVILDGFPRTVEQAMALDDLLAGMGISGPLVIHFDVPNAVLKRRLAGRRQCATCGAIYNLTSDRSTRGSRCQIDGGALVERDDDSEGVVARRLAAFDAETMPVIEYYRGLSSLGGATYRMVDGNRAPAEIAKDVCGIVGFVSPAVAA